MVRLDRLSALALPTEALAEELGALLGGGPGTLAQLMGAAT